MDKYYQDYVKEAHTPLEKGKTAAVLEPWFQDYLADSSMMNAYMRRYPDEDHKVLQMFDRYLNHMYGDKLRHENFNRHRIWCTAFQNLSTHDTDLDTFGSCEVMTFSDACLAAFPTVLAKHQQSAVVLNLWKYIQHDSTYDAGVFQKFKDFVEEITKPQGVKYPDQWTLDG